MPDLVRPPVVPVMVPAYEVVELSAPTVRVKAPSATFPPLAPPASEPMVSLLIKQGFPEPTCTKRKVSRRKPSAQLKLRFT